MNSIVTENKLQLNTKMYGFKKEATNSIKGTDDKENSQKIIQLFENGIEVVQFYARVSPETV